MAVEVFEDAVEQNINVDYLIASVGGGGLIGGLSTYSKKVSPQTTVVGVEPETAQSMKAAFQAQKPPSRISITLLMVLPLRVSVSLPIIKHSSMLTNCWLSLKERLLKQY